MTLGEITETIPLLCITDNENCCGSADGTAMGEWTFPNRSLVQINSVGSGMYRSRRTRVVRLHRREGVATDGGVFECQIIDGAGMQQELYIGVYTGEEGKVKVLSC